MRMCLTLILVILACSTTMADLWTNVAGHAIEATLMGGDGRRVTLERPNGERISVALSSLSEDSRNAATAQLQKQNPVSNADDSSRAIADRTRALHEAGQISDAELHATLGSLPGGHDPVTSVQSTRRDTFAIAKSFCQQMGITGRWFNVY